MEDCVDTTDIECTEVPINEGVGEGAEELSNGIKVVKLFKYDTTKLCAPWKHSFFIKLLGVKVTHQYLREKLISLWKVSEVFPLLDLRFLFFHCKVYST